MLRTDLNVNSKSWHPKSMIKELRSSQWLPTREIVDFQFDLLFALLCQISTSSAHYKSLLSCLFKGVETSRGLREIFDTIPILKRDQLQKNFDALLNREYPTAHGATKEVVSSGSTGRPIKILSSELTRLKYSVLDHRLHEWCRHDYQKTVGRITRPIDLKRPPAPIHWSGLFPSGFMYQFDVCQPIPKQIDWLDDLKPDYLVTYPSNLEALIANLRGNGRELEVTGIVTVGEVLESSIRQSLDEFHDAQLVDCYSAQELGYIAIQCPDNQDIYHCQDESLYVEILKSDGSPCDVGEVGRVVVTDLHNYASPLIRYELGDYAERGGLCQCGRGLSTISRIVGRKRNMAVLPSGEKIWPSFPAEMFMEITDKILQFKLRQTDVGEIELLLSVSQELDETEQCRIVGSLMERLKYPFDFKFTYADQIPRAISGKFEDFECLV